MQHVTVKTMNSGLKVIDLDGIRLKDKNIIQLRSIMNHDAAKQSSAFMHHDSQFNNVRIEFWREPSARIISLIKDAVA
ncbi:hypothetical protein KEN51_CDS0102 [Pseudomonas phage vB_Pae10145-KEN51]|uniref:PHIKZ262 n=4 Tax=Viruses TaxID=10239 RepID=Q8SCQ0_BPDPK|nr:hypothetical protein [Pseudomonas aeruginosa]NP_803828.1 PHIKZ262 [Pseudomonas phage phiKZ]YP_009617380.1 hypothetical protein FDI90_gp092 [Pseudomonas phage PA7]YP_009619603.1 hypothetical protein FDJ06_gp063 [Pseudomonas phage SL2]QGK89942.1 hypothetical protein [Pseudomonas phage vB_PA32_GUMS]QOV08164.1 hypothetical protein [Pseudomonas phage vB_PaeM_kmuB]QYV98927.1 hypothetical protein [Pseudomonas phage T2P]QYV99473.1 hypothetical protein [Pseudomonas phage U1B]QYV99563.1 hypothetic